MLLETNHNLSIILTKILQETYDKVKLLLSTDIISLLSTQLPSTSVAAKTMM